MIARVLAGVLDRRVLHGRAWTDELRRLDRTHLQRAYATAGRRLGRASLALDPPEAARLREAGVDWRLDGAGMDEIGRMILLRIAADRMSSEDHARFVGECYRQGDNRERMAVLRTLPLLPRARRFLAIALDGCRSAVASIFESIACDNPFPPSHFDERAFNGMVLRALAMGVPLGRILRLEERITAELSRLASEYVRERTAACRDVPQDAGRLLRGRAAR